MSFIVWFLIILCAFNALDEIFRAWCRYKANKRWEGLGDTFLELKALYSTQEDYAFTPEQICVIGEHLKYIIEWWSRGHGNTEQLMIYLDLFCHWAKIQETVETNTELCKRKLSEKENPTCLPGRDYGK